MVKKFMCVKHAEDCYALQEAVRFVAFFDMLLWQLIFEIAEEPLDHASLRHP